MNFFRFCTTLFSQIKLNFMRQFWYSICAFISERIVYFCEKILHFPELIWVSFLCCLSDIIAAWNRLKRANGWFFPQAKTQVLRMLGTVLIFPYTHIHNHCVSAYPFWIMSNAFQHECIYWPYTSFLWNWVENNDK